MNLLKAFVISFSLYSKIPMPQFEWEDKDMKYSLIFFPFVGMVIGAIDIGLYKISRQLNLSDMVNGLLLLICPLLITGGFHVDGFMDVQDALKSYASKERKLEIMKDPHIGAFAVIRLATQGLIYLAAILILLQKGNKNWYLVYGLSFVVARILSGIGVLKLKPAKSDGMLKHESEVNGEGVFISLIIELVLCLGLGIYMDCIYGLLLGIAGAVSFIYYNNVTKKQFGGVTGDTAGYFVVICETSITVFMAVIACIRG